MARAALAPGPVGAFYFASGESLPDALAGPETLGLAHGGPAVAADPIDAPGC